MVIVCCKVNDSCFTITVCAVVVNFQQKLQKFKRFLQICFFCYPLSLFVLQEEGTSTFFVLSPLRGFELLCCEGGMVEVKFRVDCDDTRWLKNVGRCISADPVK